MTSLELQELTKEAYDRAKRNGFYCDLQEPSNYIAAIHEELSEAFRCWNKHLGWFQVNPKPDGIYFELTDAVIRALSYCGYMGLELSEYPIDTDRPYTESDFIDLIMRSHLELSQYYELLQLDYEEDDYRNELRESIAENTFSRFISRIELFISQASEEKLNLIDLIQIKFDFNAKRGYKHGGNEV